VDNYTRKFSYVQRNYHLSVLETIVRVHTDDHLLTPSQLRRVKHKQVHVEYGSVNALILAYLRGAFEISPEQKLMYEVLDASGNDHDAARSAMERITIVKKH
jgi:hypothetical protein